MQWGLLILLLITSFSPRYLVSLSVILLFLRPNERFDLPFSVPTILYPLLFFNIVRNLKKINKDVFDKDNKVLVLFILFIFIQSLLFSRGDLKQNVMVCLLGLLYYLNIAIVLSDKRGLGLLLYSIVFSSFLICMEPFYYHFYAPQESALWAYFHAHNRIQAWGFWANANETSFLACLGIAGLLLLVLTGGRQAWNIVLCLPIFAFFIMIILLTASRAGLGALTLMFSFMIYKAKSNKLKLFVVLVMASIFIIGPSIAPEREDEEASSVERSDLRYEGRQLFKEHFLLGVGFGNTAKDNGGVPLHNTYIQAFAETGIIGGSLLLYYIYLLVRRVHLVFTSVKGNPSAETTFLLLGGIYLAGLFYFYFGNQLLSFLFFTFMAMIRSFCLVYKDVSEQKATNGCCS